VIFFYIVELILRKGYFWALNMGLLQKSGTLISPKKNT